MPARLPREPTTNGTVSEWFLTTRRVCENLRKVLRLQLTSARDALVAGDPRSALAILLDAWRETPASDLADVIDLVGALAARDVPKPGGATGEEREVAWLEAAATKDPVIRHRLVETITDVRATSSKISRGKALDGTRDPRVAAKLVEIATQRGMPCTNQFSTVWNPLFHSLALSGDPRIVNAITRGPWTDNLRLNTKLQRNAFMARLAKYVAKLESALPPVPHLASEDRVLVDEVRALVTTAKPDTTRDEATAAALLANVYATPADLGPRAIYADWLQERDDPRGELIALQLANPSERTAPREVLERCREILDQHRTAWLGPLATTSRYHRFANGFLGEAEVRGMNPQPDPRWSTVTSISGDLPATDAYPMPVLRVAKGLDRRAILRLANLATPPPLEHLTIDGQTDWSGGSYILEARSAIDAFAELVHRLPALRRLEIANNREHTQSRASPDQLGWTWRGTSIRELKITSHLVHLVTWLRLARDAHLDVFQLDGLWKVELRGTSLELRQSTTAAFEEDLPRLCDGIESIPGLSKLDMRVYSIAQWKMPQRERMQACLARIPDCATSVYGYRPPQ